MKGALLGRSRLCICLVFWLLGLLGQPGCRTSKAAVDKDRSAQNSKKRILWAVRVLGGRHVVGADRGQPDERPRRVRTGRSFWILQHEVTWAAYRACVQSGRCRPSAHTPGRDTLGRHKKNKPVDHKPVTGIDFHQAKRFCAYIGMRLPTEYEWEQAARGTDGRRFPWGNEAVCKKANFGAYDGQGPCADVNPGRVEAVGRRKSGRSPCGAFDMAGNVWEWTVRAHPNWRAEPGRAVLRGGSCCSVFLLPRSANRWVMDKTYRDTDIGFRCVSNRFPAKKSSAVRVRRARVSSTGSAPVSAASRDRESKTGSHPRAIKSGQRGEK
jgi:formylglycine-generating enzyme required for sulfatase activity